MSKDQPALLPVYLFLTPNSRSVVGAGVPLNIHSFIVASFASAKVWETRRFAVKIQLVVSKTEQNSYATLRAYNCVEMYSWHLHAFLLPLSNWHDLEQ